MVWMELTEAAQYMGYDPKYFKNLVSSKRFSQLPPIYKVGKGYRLEQGEIDEWIRSNRCQEVKHE